MADIPRTPFNHPAKKPAALRFLSKASRRKDFGQKRIGKAPRRSDRLKRLGDNVKLCCLGQQPGGKFILHHDRRDDRKA